MVVVEKVVEKVVEEVVRVVQSGARWWSPIMCANTVRWGLVTVDPLKAQLTRAQRKLT